MRLVFGIDPVADLNSITMWMVGAKDVIIFCGRFDAVPLLALVRAADGYSQSVVGGWVVYSCIEKARAEARGPEKGRLYGVVPRNDVVVIAKSPDLAVEAWNRLEIVGLRDGSGEGDAL